MTGWYPLAILGISRHIKKLKIKQLDQS